MTAGLVDRRIGLLFAITAGKPRTTDTRKAFYKRAVELPGHIKVVGKHPVNVRLHPEVMVTFDLEVTAA